MENILVAGANGTTGKQVVNLLKTSQYFSPIAMVRKVEQQKQFEDDGVKTVLADLTGDLTDAVKGVDKVVFAAGSGGKSVIEVDQEGAKRLMDASKEVNINRFVMLSSMGADDPEASDELQDYLKAKQNADKYLKESGLKYVIVRPGTLNNNLGKGQIELSEKLNKRGEISRSDVAKTLVSTLSDDASYNITFEILEGDTIIGEALNNLSN
ncbi:SDR family oxidoreductase [Winogradskyella undariae]|uniref:SDR family oxidoreductase n=1 Tax=Winogradskyella undariae TaxID=1285465 RepID=UPI0015C76F8E|nr:SDR family oxidoreductase [Winogradskyella undariae]